MKKKAPKIKKLCTVILEFNNPKMTMETIQSLRKASVPQNIQHKIIVIDNSPVPDGLLEKYLKQYPNIKYLATLQNTGFAQGNNIGIKLGLKAKCDYFLLLNNDVEVDPKFLLNMVKTLKKGADMVVPKIYFAKGYEYHKDKYKKSQLGKVIWYAGGQMDWDNVYSQHIGIDEVDKGQFDKETELEFANFCCLMLKREVFDTIGLLNENYFLYWEDADFSKRAFDAGFKQIYQPQAIIWHKNSGSSGSGSKLHDYYLTRNRLLFGMKYARSRTKIALVKESLIKLFTGREGEKKGIIDYYLRRYGKGNF
ncbi:glycosyltransferase family 2 protein [Patescibacteria group bacterium]